MTPYGLARKTAHEFYRSCAALIGEHTIRVTIVVAVPAETGDPHDLIVQCCGNATERLTKAMLVAALRQHEISRIEGGEETPPG